MRILNFDYVFYVFQIIIINLRTRISLTQECVLVLLGVYEDPEIWLGFFMCSKL